MDVLLSHNICLQEQYGKVVVVVPVVKKRMDLESRFSFIFSIHVYIHLDLLDLPLLVLNLLVLILGVPLSTPDDDIPSSVNPQLLDLC